MLKIAPTAIFGLCTAQCLEILQFLLNMFQFNTLPQYATLCNVYYSTVYVLYSHCSQYYISRVQQQRMQSVCWTCVHQCCFCWLGPGRPALLWNTWAKFETCTSIINMIHMCWTCVHHWWWWWVPDRPVCYKTHKQVVANIAIWIAFCLYFWHQCSKLNVHITWVFNLDILSSTVQNILLIPDGTLL